MSTITNGEVRDDFRLFAGRANPGAGEGDRYDSGGWIGKNVSQHVSRR